LFSRVTATILGVGLINVVSLLTFVPKMAATQVATSSPVRAAHDDALIASGELRESQRRIRRTLEEANESLKELGDKIESLRLTDPIKAQAQIDALKMLGADGKSFLVEIQKVQQQLAIRAPNDKDLADVVYHLVSVVCVKYPADCAANSTLGVNGQTAHAAMVDVVNDRKGR
jgi:hypothetical protein